MEQCAQQVVNDLVNSAKNKRMMTDNITVILVTLNRGIETDTNTQNRDNNEYIVTNI